MREKGQICTKNARKGSAGKVRGQVGYKQWQCV